MKEAVPEKSQMMESTPEKNQMKEAAPENILWEKHLN